VVFLTDQTVVVTVALETLSEYTIGALERTVSVVSRVDTAVVITVVPEVIPEHRLEVGTEIVATLERVSVIVEVGELVFVDVVVVVERCVDLLSVN